MHDDAYLTPYRESAAKHGTEHFNVTLWASPDSQRRRFQAFAEMCFLAGKRVLDAGCSRGDFAAFLLENEVPFERFIGVDGVCEVIDYAESRGLPRCEFHCGDFLADPSLLRVGDPQIICISGTLNTMTDAQIDSFLSAAWDATGEALLFNFLSDRAGRGAPIQMKPARRTDTLHWLSWALSHSCLVSFTQDYFPAGHDATILMRKGE